MYATIINEFNTIIRIRKYISLMSLKNDSLRRINTFIKNKGNGGKPAKFDINKNTIKALLENILLTNM